MKAKKVEEKYISSMEEYMANRQSYPLFAEIYIYDMVDMEFETSSLEMALDRITHFAYKRVDDILAAAGDLLVPDAKITYKITTTEIYDGYRPALLVKYYVFETKENYDLHAHSRIRSEKFSQKLREETLARIEKLKANKLNVTNAKRLLKEKGYKLVKE